METHVKKFLFPLCTRFLSQRLLPTCFPYHQIDSHRALYNVIQNHQTSTTLSTCCSNEKSLRKQNSILILWSLVIAKDCSDKLHKRTLRSCIFHRMLLMLAISCNGYGVWSFLKMDSLSYL